MMTLALIPLLGTLACLPPPPPNAETVPPTLSVPATSGGLSSLALGCGALSDGFVAVAGPSGTGIAPLVEWTRDPESGHWTYAGAVSAPGMPAITTTSASSRFVVSNGRDTVVFRSGSSSMTVLRRTQVGWEHRGTLGPTPSSTPLAVDGDTLILGNNTLQVWRRNTEGQWSLAASTPAASLGIGSATRATLRGDWLLLPYQGWPHRLAVARVESSGSLTPIQVVPAPHMLPWAFGTSVATDGDWVAVSARSSAGTSLGMAFYRRNRDGTLTLTQHETSAAGVPVHMSGNTLVTTRASWTVDDTGTWHRGFFQGIWHAVTALEPMHGYRLGVAGGDIVYLRQVGSFPTLAIWDHTASDCNGNQLSDALEIAQGLVVDCNLNGVPDDCDISLGLLADANMNGVPDACESDCDDNGEPDLTQIRSGQAADCGTGAVLATCAIAGGAPDANGDGVVDACGPDANGNGVPDMLDVAAGNAVDCDGDGRADDAPMQQLEAQWEDAGGWYYQAAGALFAVSFPNDGSGTLIGGVGLRIRRSGTGSNGYLECSAVNQPIRAAIALDPNGDGNPSDAIVVATAMGVASDTDWQVLRFEPVEITTPSYFAIFTVQSIPGTSCIDLDFNPNDCVQGNCGRTHSRAISPNPLPSALQDLVRTAMPTPNGLAVPMAVFAAPCGDVCDFNGDGFVNGADLGALLAAWGPAQGSVCDVNYDNSVDGADLGLLLSRWGAVRDR